LTAQTASDAVIADGVRVGMDSAFNVRTAERSEHIPAPLPSHQLDAPRETARLVLGVSAR
jgi:hypothetical protein